MFDGKYRTTKEIHLTDPDYDNALILHISSGEVIEVKNGKIALNDRTVPEGYLRGYEERLESLEE